MDDHTTVEHDATGRRNRGGQPENRNTTKTGRYVLAIGRLPKGCQWVSVVVRRFGRMIEKQLRDTGRTIGVAESACIQQACLAYQCSILCQRWLVAGAETMTTDQRLEYSKEILRNAQERDKALARLGIEPASLDATGAPMTPWMKP